MQSSKLSEEYIPTENPNRSAGVLLHPSSLPSSYGIGDLGPAAYAWIDALSQARQRWWQILPLGPTGFGDSPYQAFSAFAGNPLLVSPQYLREDGLIDVRDLEGATFPAGHVDYGPVIQFKNRVLAKAWQNFQTGRAASLKPLFEAFARAQASWLDDYALFMALKDAHEGRSWQEWSADARRRDPEFLRQARGRLAEVIGQHQFRQFLFMRQWQAVRDYARHRDIRIIGDIPIFVSPDSADVWANPELFQLDAQRRPRVVAGVPPDYFSATGQLWGNPLYDWEAMRKARFAWWIARFRALMTQVDVVRLDHFRGFEAYWEIPAGRPNAIEGRWVKAPGTELLTALKDGLGQLPIIAENLGVITRDVEELRTSFDLPGMRVLQFAFADTAKNPFLPHNYEQNTVVYTGTHDNDTTVGWYQTASEYEKDHVRRYLARDGRDIAWDMIRAAWSSVGDLAITPLQDVLALGSEARMNYPGRPQGNWCWRFLPEQVNAWTLDRLADLTRLYGRERTAPANGEASSGT
jgi:4-alpha-glucanotransferase